MMVLCVIQFLLKDYLHQNRSIIYPYYYTDVAPISTGVKGSPVPAGASVSLQRNDYESHKKRKIDG